MNFSKLDDFMNGMVDRGYPSCELAIAKDGEVIYRTSVGYSDAAKTRPAGNSDLYWMFSCSKVITCIAGLRLLEEGKISLDDPVSKYLPEFAKLRVKGEDGVAHSAKNTMTILHLFTMTAGLTYDVTTPEIKKAINDPDATTLSIVNAMARDPLAFEPGTRYCYSLCHDVLGAVIEVASGMLLSEYVKATIFEPLGLKNIGFHPTEDLMSRFADMYEGNSGTYKSTEMPCRNEYIFSPQYDSGGAGLYSNVDDFIAILSTIANGGKTPDGYSILRPETIALAEKNLLDDVALADFCKGRLYGYGWGLCGRVHRNPEISFSLSPVGEFGWDSAANAFSLIDTKNRVAVLFGAHVRRYDYGYHYVHPKLRNIIYECLEL